MAKIAQVTVDNFKNKFLKKLDYSYSDISGVEVLNIKIKSEKHIRSLKKLLFKNGIEYVVSGDLADASNTDGQQLINSICPVIVKRFAKMYQNYDSALVCTDRLDDTAKGIICMLCDNFKYISVATSDYNKDKFFDEVFLEKGVSILAPSENKDEPVLYLSGKRPDGKNIFCMANGEGIKIYTPDKKVISPALCEAVIKAKCGDKCDMKTEFLRLNYKVI